MSHAFIRSPIGSFTEEDNPNTNYLSSAVASLDMKHNSGAKRRGYIYFAGLPAIGSSVVDAKLQLRVNEFFVSSTIFTVDRVIESWTENQLTHNNAPAISADGDDASETVATADGGDIIEFDVTAMIQAAADGLPFFGIRITVDVDALRRVGSPHSTNPNYQPRLELTYYSTPGAPTDLQPGGGKAVSVEVPAPSWTDQFPDGDVQGKFWLQADASPDLEVINKQVTLDFNDMAAADTTKLTLGADETATALTFSADMTTAIRDLLATLPAVADNTSDTLVAHVGGNVYTVDWIGTLSGTDPGTLSMTSPAGFTPKATGGFTAGVKTSRAAFAPECNTGWVSSTVPSGNFSGLAALDEGDTRFWRVRVQNSGGIIGPWSEVARWTRIAKGTLVLNSPNADVTDTFMRFVATYTPGAGAASGAQFLLYRGDPNGLSLIYDSGRVAYSGGTDFENAPGAGLLTSYARYYVAVVRVWDDVDRLASSGDHSYVDAVFQFNLVPDDDPPAGPDTLTATPQPGGPGVLLEWTRTVADPDNTYFGLLVDGELIEDFIDAYTPSELQDGVTPFSMLWYGARNHEHHTYEIVAIELDVDIYRRSTDNPTAEAATNVIGIWLLDIRGPVWFPTAYGDAPSVQLMDTIPAQITRGRSGTTFYAIGAQRPVQEVDSQRGYEGTVSGSIDNDIAMRDRLLAMDVPGKRVRLILKDINIPVELEGVNPVPVPEPLDDFDTTIPFFQAGEF